MEPLIVTLSAADIARAAKIADGRNAGKQANGVRSNKVFEANLIGVCAKLAGCRVLGCEIDDAIRMRGDGGKDATVRGVTFQIKASNFGKGDPMLIFNGAEDFKTDAALLVKCHAIDRHEIVGIISRARFVKIATPHDFGYGERLVVPGSKLAPIAKLDKLVRTIRNEPDPEPEKTGQTNAAWLADYEAEEKRLAAG